MLLKKLIFAPLFLILITTLIYFYQPILNQYLEVFFKPYGGLYEFGALSILIALSSLTFALYVTFSQDFKYTAAVAVIVFFIPFIFLKLNLSVVLGICLVISLILAYFNLQTNLKSYINFQSEKLLLGPIKFLNTLFLVSLTIGFVLHTNSIIQTEGFKIPDPVIDWAINLSLNQVNVPVQGEKYLAQLTQEQINLLKENPEVLKQYGLDPKDLEQFVASENSTPDPKSPNQNAIKVIPSLPGADLKDVLKAQIAGSLDNIIKPYLFAIPILLGLMFYSLGSLILWILSFFLSPIIKLIFYIFEKTEFVKFEKEMREVKKIVV